MIDTLEPPKKQVRSRRKTNYKGAAKKETSGLVEFIVVGGIMTGNKNLSETMAKTTKDNGVIITTYNCWGAFNSTPYINTLLEQCDILCLQEHHLFSDNVSYLESLSSDHTVYANTSSYVNEHGRRVRQGGVAILWKKNMGYMISKIGISERIIGINIRHPSKKTLYIFCVYGPSANHSRDEFSEFVASLCDIHEKYSKTGIVMILGDINASTTGLNHARTVCLEDNLGSNHLRKARAICFTSYLLNNGLVSLTTQDICGGPIPTFYPHNGGNGTQIDHILLEKCYMNTVTKCQVEDDHSLNTSDHQPVTVHINFNVPRYNYDSRKTYQWNNVDVELYKSTLNQHIDQHNMFDRAISSTKDVDHYYSDIIGILQDVSDVAIPMRECCKYKKSFWDSELGDKHKQQKLQRSVWIHEGKPRHPDNMSYKKYKHAKRLFAKTYASKMNAHEEKRLYDMQKFEKIDSKRFWRIVARRKEHSDSFHSILHNDVQYNNPQELLLLWCEHFSILLNENPEEHTLPDDDFKRHIEQEVRDMHDQYDKHKENRYSRLGDVTMQEVKALCQSLPPRKAPGVDLIAYEHLKLASDNFFNVLCVLFNGIMNQVHIPDQMKLGLLVPLHKGHGKAKNSVNSYRGITLLPVINKVLEKLYMQRIQPHLDNVQFPPKLQFSGRKQSNCIMTSCAIQEAISYHVDNNSKISACFMDLEKAFDKVWWDGLMYKVAMLGITNKAWHLLYSWLHGSQCSVLLNGQISKSFDVTRGIKQGGSLSMFLFNAYLHDIHDVIENTNIARHSLGVSVNGYYIGSPAYADDLVLLSGTKHGLDEMISRTLQYANQWRMKFSAQKTKCITFGESKKLNTRNKQLREFSMEGVILDEVSSVTHVGVTLESYKSASTHIQDCCNKGKSIMAALYSDRWSQI